MDARFKANKELQDAVRETINVAIRGVEETANTARTYGEKAVDKAEAASEKRWQSSNEFRETLEDQATHFATKEDVEQRYAINAEKIAGLTARLGRIEGMDIGAMDTTKSHRENTNLKIALGVGIMSFLSLAIGAIGLFIALYHKA